MPTAFEERVAFGRGIRHQDRNLSQAIADFYLRENLANVRHYSPAVRLLDELEHALAREFAEYLDIAIGGELRHATAHLELDEECLPIELAPFFPEVSVAASDRGEGMAGVEHHPSTVWDGGARSRRGCFPHGWMAAQLRGQSLLRNFPE
ncbi:MAG: hypothetical protein ABR552_07645 [Actinomycetota bacterium]